MLAKLLVFSYLARPVDEVKSATLEERNAAMKSAEKIQCSQQSKFPSFIKSMVRSHVYSCFWLVSRIAFVFISRSKKKTNLDNYLNAAEDIYLIVLTS